MKKILILTVTAGNAHNECARRMKDRLLSLDNKAEVKIVDVLKSYSSLWYTWVADGGYNFAVSKALPIYHSFYKHFKKTSKAENKFCSRAQGAALTITAGVFKEILDFKPDVVYCTHFYPAIALTNLKMLYDIPCRVVSTILDYVYEPFIESANGVDKLIIPNEDFIEEGVKLGYNLSQLMPIGLPVDNCTFEQMDKLKARRELGINENKTTILVMFGGGLWAGGFKIFKNLISSLKGQKVQVIMINGKNKRDFNRISKMKFNKNINVVNVGFTDKVSLYMSASDIIINKCGGASSTEMVNKTLPMLITTKIPTQELYNLDYLKKKGCALSFKNKKELKRNILMLLDDENKRNEMTNCCQKLRKDSLNLLADYLLTLPKADYSSLVKEDIDFDKIKRRVKKMLKEENKKQNLIAKEEQKVEKLQEMGG